MSISRATTSQHKASSSKTAPKKGSAPPSSKPKGVKMGKPDFGGRDKPRSGSGPIRGPRRGGGRANVPLGQPGRYKITDKMKAAMKKGKPGRRRYDDLKIRRFTHNRAARIAKSKAVIAARKKRASGRPKRPSRARNPRVTRNMRRAERASKGIKTRVGAEKFKKTRTFKRAQHDANRAFKRMRRERGRRPSKSRRARSRVRRRTNRRR